MIKTFEEFGIIVSICKCALCLKTWIARKNPEEIVLCPRCKRKDWNKDNQSQREEEKI